MDEQINGANLPFRDTLQKRATEKQQELERLAAKQAEIATQIATVREYIVSLNRLLEVEGLEPIPIPDNLVRLSGRVSVATPTKREAYADMKLADAVEAILEESGELHADDIVRAIFDVRSPEDLIGGKQNVVSTLTRKAGVRDWERVQGKPNTFRTTRQKIAAVT